MSFKHQISKLIFVAVVFPALCLSMFALAPGMVTAAGAAGAASAGGNEEIKNALRDLLREDPNLVLDVLRENSELVLDIAQQGSELRRHRILVGQWRADLEVPKNVNLEGRPVKGPDKAPVTIVAYTDFTCLHCRNGEITLERILKAYPGQVRVVYKSLPMSSHPGAVEAAEFMLAAYMQSKEKSWKLFDDFFENRDLIVGKSGDTYLRSAASARGLNMQKLLSDAKSARIKKMLQEDEKEAQALKIQGTPFFLVNNIEIRGALQENLFREAVNMALAYENAKK
ncbi:thioredoxin domain-containing protein [Desulfovibrio sp. OttesenSCG-928-C06]|nr:thioredoxin domain-containing protein [Desulfovibrio sp. OttesenSCG-928-C06]